MLSSLDRRSVTDSHYTIVIHTLCYHITSHIYSIINLVLCCASHMDAASRVAYLSTILQSRKDQSIPVHLWLSISYDARLRFGVMQTEQESVCVCVCVLRDSAEGEGATYNDLLYLVATSAMKRRMQRVKV